MMLFPEKISLTLIAIGGLIALVGHLMVTVAAFQKSNKWGYGALFIPLAALVFSVIHFKPARRALVFGMHGMFTLFLGFGTLWWTRHQAEQISTDQKYANEYEQRFRARCHEELSKMNTDLERAREAEQTMRKRLSEAEMGANSDAIRQAMQQLEAAREK